VKGLGVASNAAFGVKARTKLCVAPAAIETAVFGEPVTLLVAGSVVWKAKTAGTETSGAQAQLAAVLTDQRPAARRSWLPWRRA